MANPWLWPPRRIFPRVTCLHNTIRVIYIFIALDQGGRVLTSRNISYLVPLGWVPLERVATATFSVKVPFTPENDLVFDFGDTIHAQKLVPCPPPDWAMTASPGTSAQLVPRPWDHHLMVTEQNTQI